MAEKVTNLKEIAATVTSKESSENLFQKLGSNTSVHGFNKGVIKINNFKPIDSINELMNEEEERYIRIPFAGVNYVSTKFTLEEIEGILMNDPKYNVEVSPMSSKISELDLVINPELREVAEELKNEKVTPVPLIKGVKLSKEGKIFIVLNNKAMITNQLIVSNLSTLVDNIQGSLRKEVIPDSLLKLRNDYFLVKQDLRCLKIGRISNELVMEIELKELCKKVLVPRLILEKGSFPFLSNDNTKSECLKKYAHHVKVNSTYDYKNLALYFSLETEGTVSALEMVINKKNFVCLNASYTNEFLKRFIADKVSKYLDRVKFEKEKDEERYAHPSSYLEMDVRMVPLANLSKQISAIKNVPITEMIKITKNNNPLYIPVLEFNSERFISSDLNPIFNSFTFRNIVKKKPSFNELLKLFSRYTMNRDPFVSEFSMSDDSRVALIPDPKRLVLSLYLEDSDVFKDYGISLNTKESMSSFSIQRV